jgi:hypothetical protein
LLPDNLDERRDLGLVYLRNGRPYPAIKLVEDYIRESDEEQAEMLTPYLRAARRMAAELN